MAIEESLYRDDVKMVEGVAREISQTEPVAAVLLFQLVELVLYEYEGGAVPGSRAAEINSVAPLVASLLREPSDQGHMRDLAAAMLKTFPRFEMLMSA